MTRQDKTRIFLLLPMMMSHINTSFQHQHQHRHQHQLANIVKYLKIFRIEAIYNTWALVTNNDADIVVPGNGTYFTSLIFKQYCELHDTGNLRNVLYHPQPNGQATRAAANP
uniref:Uncharacterized protein n=1 Tax=Glossina brevipalpis TaxID=37001 RepID=A0A1A9WYB8_9MUSC